MRINRDKAIGIAIGAVVALTVQNLSSSESDGRIARALCGDEEDDGDRSLHKNGMCPPIEKEEGWHPVHVYYGKQDHLNAPVQDWYSQVGQDEIVHKLLGENSGGFFVDLASNDATYLSNTYALEQRGWNGLCIEPNPAYWYRLSFRKCHVAAALVGNDNGVEVEATFGTNNANGVHGGIVGFDNTVERTQDNDWSTVKRYTASLPDVLGGFDVPKTIDYLSLDVEGAEEYIMNAFPFEEYTFKLMTVERPSAELQKLLKSNGYVQLAKLVAWGETLWAHESMELTPEKFTALTGRPTSPQ